MLASDDCLVTPIPGGPAMAVLSTREIYEAAREAGFTPHQAVTWTAIAMAES